MEILAGAGNSLAGHTTYKLYEPVCMIDIEQAEAGNQQQAGGSQYYF